MHLIMILSYDSITLCRKLRTFFSAPSYCDLDLDFSMNFRGDAYKGHLYVALGYALKNITIFLGHNQYCKVSAINLLLLGNCRRTPGLEEDI